MNRIATTPRIIIALAMTLSLAAGCKQQTRQPATSKPQTTPQKKTAPPKPAKVGSGAAADEKKQAKGQSGDEQPKAARAGASGGKVVEIDTSLGAITIELNSAKAPKTVANFLAYVRSGHYNGTIFHRVIPTFMIQGGGFDDMMRKKPTRAPIQNEADNGLSNRRGTIAMARTRAPHSASAQFFINVKDNPALDHKGKSPRGWGYCVFGKVTKGMDVVDKIKVVPTSNRGMHANVPNTPVLIKTAKVVR